MFLCWWTEHRIERAKGRTWPSLGMVESSFQKLLADIPGGWVSSWWFQPIWKILVKLEIFPEKNWSHHLDFWWNIFLLLPGWFWFCWDLAQIAPPEFKNMSHPYHIRFFIQRPLKKTFNGSRTCLDRANLQITLLLHWSSAVRKPVSKERGTPQ